MTEPSDIRTFPEWQSKYVVIRRWAYVVGVIAQIVIGALAGFVLGIRVK